MGSGLLDVQLGVLCRRRYASLPIIGVFITKEVRVCCELALVASLHLLWICRIPFPLALPFALFLRFRQRLSCHAANYTLTPRRPSLATGTGKTGKQTDSDWPTNGRLIVECDRPACAGPEKAGQRLPKPYRSGASGCLVDPRRFIPFT